MSTCSFYRNHSELGKPFSVSLASTEMASNTMFSFEDYSFDEGRNEKNPASKIWETFDCANTAKRAFIYGADEWEESIDIGYGLYRADKFGDDLLFSKDQQHELKSCLDYEIFNDQRFHTDMPSPTFQSCLQEIAKLGDEVPSGVHHFSEPKMGNQNQNQAYFSFASLGLLKKYDNGRINSRRMVEPDAPCTKLRSMGWSTEEIIRIAGARFIQSCCQSVDIASSLHNPFGLSFTNLSDEDSMNVELVELLLASAEKVGYQQFERAGKLLNHCDSMSSNIGNPVQRVVYYFSDALRERIDREIGRFSSMKCFRKCSDLEETIFQNPASVTCLQNVPFIQVARFTAIQAIVENVVGAKKIHIIDLDIRNGSQWSLIMQALLSQHDCSLELLKITAIGTTSKHVIENTGKRLASFAKSMNTPFSFKAILVSDMLDLKEELFELDSDEAVAIYSEYLLMNLIFAPDRLESIMRTLRNINPNVMVVMEVEANNNSPSFVNRFIEALFYYSAYFDCFDACIERDDPNRIIIESNFFNQGIRDMVACEGEERRIRHVKFDVWRSFFSRFGMTETELSSSSLYQASLLLKTFACGSFCTIAMNEKSLLIGWKGTPLHSLSVWKFF